MFFSLLCSASGAQTAQREPVLAAQSAAHLSMTVGSTRGRSSSPATALRPAARPQTAPSAPPQENACGRDSLSAQVNLKSVADMLNFISVVLILDDVHSMYFLAFLPFQGVCIKISAPGISAGETRRILSVNPTYDWTCFSYALLNVSPMQVESSPPMPCPPPCHTLKNCTLCLGSRGSDGGWQHCVWSMALQRVRRRHLSSSLPDLFSENGRKH